MFLIRLSDTDTAVSSNQSKQTTAAEEPDKTKITAPIFEFYDLLKETKVSLPESFQTSADAEQSASAQPNFEYILQVASFRNRSDAEEVRAGLILLNLDARVEEAKIQNGDVWHRVLSGPYESRSKLSKARETLIGNGYEALILKRAKQKTAG